MLTQRCPENKIVNSSENYSGEKVLIFKMEMVRNTVVISNNFRSYYLMKESMVHNCTSRREVFKTVSRSFKLLSFTSNFKTEAPELIGTYVGTDPHQSLADT